MRRIRRKPQNLLIPLRRDEKQDFDVGSGPELLASKVRQALLTEGATPRSSGELPWHTNFGAALPLLRHQRNDAPLQELARVYVRDDLQRWVPGAKVVSFEVEQEGAAHTLRLRVRAGCDCDRGRVPISIGSQEFRDECRGCPRESQPLIRCRNCGDLIS